MKKLYEYDETYRICFVIWNTMRNFGFTADEIFVSYEPILDIDGDVTDTTEKLFVQLRTQNKQFTATIKHIPSKTYEEVLQEWNRFVERLPNAPDEEIRKAMDVNMNTPAYAQSLALRMLNKGFSIPNL